MSLGGTTGSRVVKSFLALINWIRDKKAKRVGGHQPQLARIGGVDRWCLISDSEARTIKRKEIDIITGINNNNKYVPQALKTYEVRFIENQEPSKLTKLASYLGLKTVENCSGCSEGSPGRDKNFQLSITLKNFTGGSLSKSVYDIDAARSAAGDILAAAGDWADDADQGGFNKKNREELAEKINEKISYHTQGVSINDSCYVAGKFLE